MTIIPLTRRIAETLPVRRMRLWVITHRRDIAARTGHTNGPTIRPSFDVSVRPQGTNRPIRPNEAMVEVEGPAIAKGLTNYQLDPLAIIGVHALDKGIV